MGKKKYIYKTKNKQIKQKQGQKARSYHKYI